MRRRKLFKITIIVPLILVCCTTLVIGATSCVFTPTRPPGQNASNSITATLVIAASDSLNKQGADYFCDGIDDNKEIQAAIYALSAKGGKVVLMSGNYSIGSRIELNSSGVVLQGMGWSTKLKLADRANCHLMAISGTDICVTDMLLDGNKANQAAGSVVLWCERSERLGLKNLFIENGHGDNIVVAESSEATISDCHSTEAGKVGEHVGAGIELGSGVVNTTITNCNLWNNTQGGILLSTHEEQIGAEGVLISGCNLFENSGGFGTVAGFAQASRYKDISIINSIFKDNESCGINIQRCENVTVSGCQFSGNPLGNLVKGDATFSSRNITIEGNVFEELFSTQGDIEGITITGNTFNNGSIYVADGNPLIEDNSFYGFMPSSSPLSPPCMIRPDKGATIIGNKMLGTTESGSCRAIWTSIGGVSNLYIVGNEIRGIRSSDSTGYGMLLDSLVKSNIQSNLVTDCDVGMRIISPDKETLICDNLIIDNDINRQLH